ncbi:MAG: S8/S53 family peptidase [Anaerolineales bacterium]
MKRSFCTISVILVFLLPRSYASWRTANPTATPAATSQSASTADATASPVLEASPTVELPWAGVIQRRPLPTDYRVGELSVLPVFNPTVEDAFQVDLRGADLSTLDLRNSQPELRYSIFDSRTVWPPPDRMPACFDPVQIMELGKNPGLCVREIHQMGITGRNAGIAIIDMTLLADHHEYTDRLRFYEEINYSGFESASMHGPAVASLAVGRTTGVAPDADLYFIAVNGLVQSSTESTPKTDFRYLAQAVRRILEVNKRLPRDRRIRVISMSIGWGPEDLGAEELNAATDEAKAEAVLIVSGSRNMTRMYGIKMFGLGRPVLADPDSFSSYGLALFWVDISPDDTLLQGSLCIPMDSRTTASFTGVDDYVYFSIGGGSWTMPYLAGSYALAVQVKPDFTPEEFLSSAVETGREITYPRGGREILLHPVIDPVALINALR